MQAQARCYINRVFKGCAMGKINIALLMVLAVPANAEVFKCRLDDKTVYQATPCPPNAIKQRVLDIQPTAPDKVIEAEQQLDTWKSELAVREAAEQQAKKERQEMLDKQTVIEALKRSAEAQEAMAEANRQPIVINPPVYLRPMPRFFKGKPDGRRRQHGNDDRPMPSGRNPSGTGNTAPSGWITPTH